MDRVFSFLLWPKRGAHGPWKQGRKKWGSITCPTDWANEANKMFIIWFCWLFRFWKGDRELKVRTATYGPGIDQSQHAKSVSHIIKINIHVYYICWQEPSGWHLTGGVLVFVYVTEEPHIGGEPCVCVATPLWTGTGTCNWDTPLRSCLHEPGLAANPGQDARAPWSILLQSNACSCLHEPTRSDGRFIYSTIIVGVWLEKGWPGLVLWPGLAANSGSCKWSFRTLYHMIVQL